MKKKQYEKPLVRVVLLQHSSPILSGSPEKQYGLLRNLQEEEEVDEAW